MVFRCSMLLAVVSQQEESWTWYSHGDPLLSRSPLDTEHWSRREPRRRTKVTNTHTLHFITHLYTCRLDGAPACNAQVLISNYFRPCLLFEAWGLWCLESRGCLPVPHAAQEEGAFCLQRSFWRELDDNGKGAIIAGSLRRNLKPEPMH